MTQPMLCCKIKNHRIQVRCEIQDKSVQRIKYIQTKNVRRKNNGLNNHLGWLHHLSFMDVSTIVVLIVIYA